MKELTWPWLGGFFQAGGYVSRPAPKAPRALTVVQAKREPLDLIHQFLSNTLPSVCFVPVRGPYGTNIEMRGNYIQRGIYVQGIYGGLPDVLSALSPWLRSEKRERAVEWLRILHRGVPEYQLINDDWIVGFWEGGGGVGLSDSAHINFTQGDATVFGEIQAHLMGRFGCGSRYLSKYKVAQLNYSCSVRDPKMPEWLYENVRCEFRRSQLRVFLEALRRYREDTEEREYANFGRPGYHTPSSIKVLYQRR